MALCAMEWLLSPNVLTSSWHTLVLDPFLSIPNTLLGLIWVACRSKTIRDKPLPNKQLEALTSTHGKPLHSGAMRAEGAPP